MAERALRSSIRVAVDAKGNLYTGEVDGSARVQKFLRYDATGCYGSGSVHFGSDRN